MAVSQIQNASLASGVPGKANLPTGSVLQVVQTVKTNTFSSTSATFGDITGLTVSITPTSSSSKILVMGVLNISTSSNDMIKVQIARGGSAIFIADTVAGATSALTQLYTGGSVNIPGANWSTYPVSAFYLDSPATTSSTTYSWQIRVQTGGNTVWVNRGADQSGSTNQNFYGASSIIVMEIAA